MIKKLPQFLFLYHFFTDALVFVFALSVLFCFAFSKQAFYEQHIFVSFNYRQTIRVILFKLR